MKREAIRIQLLRNEIKIVITIIIIIMEKIIAKTKKGKTLTVRNLEAITIMSMGMKTVLRKINRKKMGETEIFKKITNTMRVTQKKMKENIHTAHQNISMIFRVVKEDT